jgi:hypothetical protein
MAIIVDVKSFLAFFWKIKNKIFLGAGPFSWGGGDDHQLFFLSGLTPICPSDGGKNWIFLSGRKRFVWVEENAD